MYKKTKLMLFAFGFFFNIISMVFVICGFILHVSKSKHEWVTTIVFLIIIVIVIIWNIVMRFLSILQENFYQLVRCSTSPHRYLILVKENCALGLLYSIMLILLLVSFFGLFYLHLKEYKETSWFGITSAMLLILDFFLHIFSYVPDNVDQTAQWV